MYLERDIEHFVMRAPYLQLSRLQGACRFLSLQLDCLEQSFRPLSAYPEVQVEHLEFFYVTARSLSVLNHESLRIMLTSMTWRGVVWGGWLALMRPQPSFVEPLAAATAAHSENLWAVECTLALLAGKQPPPELAALYALAARARHALYGTRITAAPLRLMPSDAERPALEAEYYRVLEVYRREGAERARQVALGTRLHQHNMPYAQWLRDQKT